MIRRETYLDWNATTPLRPEARAAVAASLARCGNPSSVHRWGRAARQSVERARDAVAALIGAAPESVIFVSGGIPTPLPNHPITQSPNHPIHPYNSLR